jgi:hypothetical protein
MSLALAVYHLLTSVLAPYGYFIDELYYVACSKRLACGYVDHPPLSIALLAMSRWLMGDSLPAIRFLSALASGGTVFLTGLLAHRLGGSRTAVLLAALATMAAPVYLVMGSFYSMNAFEPLLWTGIIYLAVRMVQEENPKLWLPVGILVGLGLEMKHTMVLYVIALLAGMLCTPWRRLLWSRWTLWGAACAFLLLLPNIVWQAVNDFPSLTFYRNAMVNKNIPTAPLGVLAAQVLFLNPASLPLWVAGLAFLFIAPAGARTRFLGWAYLALLAVLVASGSSRPDRITAMYTVLFAAGSVAIGRIVNLSLRRTAWTTMAILLAVGGALLLPVCTPLLAPPALRSHIAALGWSFDIESGKMNEPLPQWLADRLGWRELASDVAEVCAALPADERRDAVIVSTNYGEAGALELYGAEFHLPRVYATHNSYHTWGSPADSVKTYVCVYVNGDDLRRRFESVVEAKVHTCADCTRPQRSIPIYVARGPQFSMSAAWRRFKTFN